MIYFTNICNFLILHLILIGFSADCMVLKGLGFDLHAFNVAIPLRALIEQNE